jgi:hypothetical protein
MSDTKTSSAGKDNRVEKAIKKLHSGTLGCCGAIYIDDTSVHAGPYTAVQVIGTADAVLDVSAMSPTNGDVVYEDFDVDITIPKGSIIYGKFINIALVSGAVLAYKAG